MSKSNIGQSNNLGVQAERVFSASLRAAHDVAGVKSMLRASDAWLHSLESLECSEQSAERFLRHVTTLAISELLAESGNTLDDKRQRTAGESGQQADMQVAA